MDLVGQVGSSLVVLLPELGAQEAEDVSLHVVERISPLAPQARAGLAISPRNGLDADALMATARAAALAAQPGQVRVSGPDTHRMRLGERSVVVADPVMVELFALLERLALNPQLPVLVHGETGSGKENAAWALHHWSSRRSGPFVALNCAAIPESLAESELFGNERGAFTGADRARAGVLERASGGTLFLDEVAELPLSVQTKLLRALDEKRITRLGDTRERDVDVRLVAATHKVLEQEVKAGRFRNDLFFRLNAKVVVLPPLRERLCELPVLTQVFFAEACTRLGRPSLEVSAAAMSVLMAHPWPGNVRELKNAVECLATLTVGSIVEPADVLLALQRADRSSSPSGFSAGIQGDVRPESAPRAFSSLAEEAQVARTSARPGGSRNYGWRADTGCTAPRHAAADLRLQAQAVSHLLAWNGDERV